MLAFAPHYPLPREEMWFFVLADPADNGVLGITRVSLLEAEFIQAQQEEAAAPALTAAADGADGKVRGAFRLLRAAACRTPLRGFFQQLGSDLISPGGGVSGARVEPSKVPVCAPRTGCLIGSVLAITELYVHARGCMDWARP